MDGKISKEELYMRQLGIVNRGELEKSKCAVLGTGSVGSFTVMALSKMGVGRISGIDMDVVSIHNLPSQFYKLQNINKDKVLALYEIVEEFSGGHFVPVKKKFEIGSQLPNMDVIIVATDNMLSREAAYREACRQGCWFIDARMGAELGIVYRINTGVASHRKFYEKTLHSDDEAEELPCTARTIIYNVLMISSLICRAYKSIVMKEKKFPKEIIFNMTRIDEISLMISK